MTRGLLLAGALLAGCTVGPNYHSPAISTPEHYAEAQDSGGPSDAELAGWWSGFGDPQLSDLVNRALAQNLDVEMAAARIREARAREIVAGAARLPEVDAQGSVARQRISENAIPVPPGSGSGGGGTFGLPGSEFTTFRVGFDASWELDLFGKTRRSVEAARARTGAAIWNRRDLQVTIAAEVVSAYLTLRTVQHRIANAEAELARQQRFEQLVAARTRAGWLPVRILPNRALNGRPPPRQFRRSTPTPRRKPTRLACSPATHPKHSSRNWLPLKRSPRLPRFPPVSPQTSCAADRTSVPPSGSWPRPQRTSGSRSPTSIPASR